MNAENGVWKSQCPSSSSSSDPAWSFVLAKGFNDGNCSYFNTSGVREMQLIQPSHADCLVRVSGVKPRSYISAINYLVVRLLYVDLRSAAEPSIALSQMSDQIVCVRVSRSPAQKAKEMSIRPARGQDFNLYIGCHMWALAMCQDMQVSPKVLPRTVLPAWLRTKHAFASWRKPTPPAEIQYQMAKGQGRKVTGSFDNSHIHFEKEACVTHNKEFSRTNITALGYVVVCSIAAKLDPLQKSPCKLCKICMSKLLHPNP